MTKQPTKRSDFLLPETYKGLLKEIKGKVRSSQLKAAIAVNQEMLKLYWDIGCKLLEKQKNEGWGRVLNLIDFHNAFRSKLFHHSHLVIAIKY